MGGIGYKSALPAERVDEWGYCSASGEETECSGEDDGEKSEGDAAHDDVEPADIDHLFVASPVEESGKRDLVEHEADRGHHHGHDEDGDGDSDPQPDSDRGASHQQCVGVGAMRCLSHSNPSRYPRPRTVVTISGSVLRRR